MTPTAPFARPQPPQPGKSPLRAQTVREAARTAAPALPQVLHVTIDRIDVRLPPAPTPAPRTAARPRPASSLPSLGDYLRPRNGGGQ